MSDQDQSNVNSQQEQQEDQQNSQQQDQDQDQEDQQDQDQDDQQGSGDEDQDEDDQSGEDGDQDQEKQDEDQEDDQNKKLPTFSIPQRAPPTQFKFTSLLSQISNLSCSVDNFIGTLHTSTTSSFPRRPYTNYAAQQTTYQPRLQDIKVPQPPAQSRIVIMKDQDTQVDMKPQIIIQPTKPIKEDPVIQSKPYKISTQSQKFLAQLYEQNKKLKRWQANPSHPMSSYMNSYTGSNGFGMSSNGFYGSRDKFQRKQYEKGLFNVQERNRQIDEAIMQLKRQQQDY